MKFIKRIAVWFFAKATDLIHQERNKEVFILAGPPMDHKCPYCGFQAYRKINTKKDWGSISLGKRFMGILLKYVCFNSKCQIYGRPYIYRKIYRENLAVQIPSPVDEIVYRKNAENIKFPEGGVQLFEELGCRPYPYHNSSLVESK